MTADDVDTAAARYEWERIVRRARLGAPTTAVALALATYADRDGSRIFPGADRLAAVTEYSIRSVRESLKKLRTLGLIERVTKGGHRGGAAVADVYRLAIPVDLFEVVEMLPVSEEPPSQPAPPARWEVSQPAPPASQPAGGASPTGTSCTPPVVTTNHTPNQLQNDNSSLETNVQNAREDETPGNVVLGRFGVAR